ncbi:S-adenosyl-L-methionine-dependent methyltransferase [Stereum hirsutum FP-91666 SS1]|uniref:S-adenosyl-L-methionine-dependent methyltransferase n=1 Tax=Stereum hirsutum (strain FP-91666) TaxID=721885 RepID=UPI000444A770|nr:S-adenosyl-L-methionine-dependent methyltransferase [Stereum hirsutum FP-91666 SS1]EIM86234.1 S-adenosyl-L-methionine-dependent methyltransferase [Stereum hirsutum FP-91666 SS1]
MTSVESGVSGLYLLPQGGDDEWKRLDEMHAGINEYLGNRLSLANFGRPDRILELGCGSGAWAIQAAKTYPHADVQAVDASPLPPRPLPSNLTFQRANIFEPLPFESQSFDLIHLRLVLFYVPNVHDILPRIIALLKPGGWLVIEDICLLNCRNSGPCHEELFRITDRYMRSRACDPCIGENLEAILKESRSLVDLSSLRVDLPFYETSQEDPLAPLAKVMKTSVVGAMTGPLSAELVADGLTSELQAGFGREMEDARYKPAFCLHFYSARKQ